MLLIRQNVDGENKPQKAVDDAAGQPRHKGEQPRRHAPYKVLDEGTGLVQQLLALIPQVADDFVFHIQLILQAVKEISGLGDITGDVIGQAQKTFSHLRQDEKAQPGDNGQHTQDGKDNAEAPLAARQAGAAAPQPGQPFGFHRAHQQVDDISHDHPDDDRPQYRHDVAAGPCHQPDVGQHQVQHNAIGDEKYAALQRGSIHGWVSFSSSFLSDLDKSIITPAGGM